ncbi:MAG TPA: aspartyl/asparaginyl beta-hydroxylase domain-containing protein, partial [Thermoanaerobaculia bacterium]
MEQTELYAVSADLNIQLTPAGTFTVQFPEWRRSREVNRDEMEVLLKFSHPSSLDSVFGELSLGWEIERAEFDELVGAWLHERILTRANGPDDPSRLQLFRRAMADYIARDRGGRFPLSSPFRLQRPDFYYPGLSAREVHDRERFPWTADLEAAAPRILEELDGLLARREGFSEVYKDHTSTGSWAAAYFWVFGKRVDATCDACPETARILGSIPGVT